MRYVRDVARRLGPVGTIRLECALGSRGDCQEALSSMSPQIKILSGVDLQAPCYLLVMRGGFPSTRAEEEPRCAAALIVDVGSGRLVASSVSTVPPDVSSMSLVQVGTV